MSERRMKCVVCNGPLGFQPETVCNACSTRLRAGETIKAPRVYCMPNCVDSFVRFRLKNGNVEWKFPDESKYAVCMSAMLSLDVDHELSRMKDASDAFHARCAAIESERASHAV